MDQSDWIFISEAELSIHHALLGKVNPSLRKVYIEWKPGNEIIFIYYIHHGELTPKIKDHYAIITSNVKINQLSRPLRCLHEVIRCDFPNDLDAATKERFLRLIYSRKEPFLDPR